MIERQARKWFWTPEQLATLRRVLDKACERDEAGCYFGGMDLGGYVEAHGPKFGLRVDASQARNGIHILTYLGGLEIGARGRKNPDSGYKRRYYPEKIQAITWEDVNRYRYRLRPRNR